MRLSSASTRFVIVLVLIFCALFAVAKFGPSTQADAESQAFVPVLGATKTASILTDVNGNGLVNPGDSLRYLVTINNTGADPATGVTFNDTIDANTTLIGGSTIASAIAVNESYSSIGNVGISVPDGASDLLANDLDANNPGSSAALVIVSPPTTTTQGGQVSINPTTGAFTYNPPPGFEGADTFTYTLSNGTTLTDTATVTINVSGMIWFINNNAAGCTTLAAGCGRLNNPFSTLAAFQALNNGTGNNPAANDNIFVYESVTGYPGGVTLLSGQKLIGQDATATLATISGVTVPTFSFPALPAMNTSSPTTNFTGTTTLNTNTTLRGFSVNSTTLTGINDPAGAITGVNASEIIVATTTGTAVLLSSTGGTFSFRSISSSGAANGISLNTTTGSFIVTGDGSTTGGFLDRDGSGGTITGSTSHAVSLNNAQNVTLSQMNITNTAAGGACPASCTANAVNGSGGSNIVLSAVLLQNLGGHGWYHLNLSGTNRFDNNAQVQNWQTSNAVGVYIDNTNTNFTSFTVDHAFFTTSSTGADGFLFDGNGATSGAVTVTNNDFTLIDQDAVQVNNDGTGDMTVVVQTNNFHDADATSGDGNNTLFLSNAGSGDLNFTIGGVGVYPGGQGNRFDNVARLICACGVLQVNSTTTGQTGTRLLGNIQSNTINNSTGRRGIDIGIEANGGSHGGHDVTIQNNTTSNTVSMGINVLVTSVNGGSSANNEFSILNNSVTMTSAGGTADSGTALEIETNDANNNATISNNILVQGNTLINNNSSGVGETIEIFNRAVNAGVISTMNLTVLGNTITNSNAAGQVFEVASSGISGTQNLCLDLNSANTNFNNYTGVGLNGFKLTNNYGTYNIEGLVGSPSAFLGPRNRNNGVSPAVITAGGAVGTFGAAGTCTMPTFAPPDGENLNSTANAVTNDGPVSSVMESMPTAYASGPPALRTVDSASAFLRDVSSFVAEAMSKAGESISPTVNAQETTKNAAAPQSGETVNKALGTLPPGENIRVQFDVSVDANIPTNDFSVSNTAGITSTNHAPINSTTATTTVVHPPTLSKAFGAANIALNGTTTLTFTIGNANPATAFTNVAFSDTLPAGMVIATPNGLVNNCGGGTITATQGTGVFSVSALARPANSTCTIVINVLGTTDGTKNNLTGTISSTQGGTGLTAAASVNVITAPSFTKAFGAATIPLNGSTSLSFTITNNSPNSALSGVGFTDTLPAGLVVATPNGQTGSCGGGTITATPGAGSVSLSGATLSASANCTFSVNVTGTTAGVKNNSVQMSSTQLGNGATANASVTVVAPPTITKAFSPTTILQNNGFSTMTITITNPNAGTALSGVGVVDPFPAGMEVDATPTATNTCGGTFAPAAGNTSVTLSGGSIAASANCAISVRVRGTTAGAKLNTTNAVTSTNGGDGLTASATLTVTNTAVWSGATSANWATATNWTLGVAPISTNDVDIPAAGVTNNPVISAASVTVNNLTEAAGRTLTINSGINLGVTGTCTINGTMVVAGSFTCGTLAGTGTVSFTGAAAQNIPALTYNNLTINNAAGTTLVGNTTVNGVLTLTSGNINTGANTLTIGPSGSISRTSGHVVGTLAKIFTATGPFTFHVGTTGYSPLATDVTALAVNPSTLTVRANDGTAPAAPPLNDATTLDRFWSLTESGDLTANLLFTYLQSDVDGNELAYRTIRVSGGVATGLPNMPPCPGAGSPCVDPGANTIKVNGVSAFSEWTAGEFAPTAAAVGISGRVVNTQGRGVSGALVTIADPNGTIRYATTNQFGFYRFLGVTVGEAYLISVQHKSYQFAPRVVSVNDEMLDVDFVPIE